MSIIQEALRRKEEEEQLKGEGEANGSRTPPPPPSSPSSKKKGGKPWLSVLIALVVLAAAAGGIFILFNTGLRGILTSQKKEKNAQTEAAPQQESESEAAQSKIGQIVGKVGDTLKNAKNRVEEQETETATMQGGNGETASTEASSSPGGEKSSQTASIEKTNEGQDPEAATVEEAQATSSPSPNIKVIVDKPKPKEKRFKLPKMIEESKQSSGAGTEKVVDWPLIEVKGIMAPGSGNRGAVLINSQLLSEGDSYKGARILKISQTTVLLELEGQRRLLNTGQSLGAD